MIHQGCQAAVMEVSSHGLAQNRCASINFEQAIFTNLSQDHLDYHLTMEAYAAEKEKLFSTLTPEKRAIVNLESPWTPMMLARCKAKIFTYGFSPQADLCADALSLESHKTEFSVHFQGETIRMEWGMIGRYNVLNGLAALAACLEKGFTLAQLKPLLQKFKGVPGRLEKIENFRGIHIYVDYAHSPDALEKVLNCLREIKKGKMITVFGCGGDRDKGKRPKMGKIAEEGSDFTIITSDNPRSEEPANICDEIASGFSGSNFCVTVDRQKAIEKAIEMAAPEDLILIAGKGHEKYQQFSYQTIPFDDRVIAQKIVNKVSFT
jgi:UDP-N-acetylmuramoyl-L-alanyl-D-glutamate--2,6-diaminopimelate ligase